MSLLDELKKKAEKVKLEEIENEDTTITTVDAAIREQNAEILNKKLDFIHGYLNRLVESLNVIKPDNTITYNLIDQAQAHHQINNVKKTNFSVHEGKSGNGNRVILKYDLYANQGLTIKIRNDQKVPIIRRHFSERNVKYFETDAEGDLIKITLANPVSTRFIYAADLDHCMIVLKLDNFKGPWAILTKFMPEDITEELMDETAKYILGEQSRFEELTGNAV